MELPVFIGVEYEKKRTIVIILLTPVICQFHIQVLV